VTTKAEPNDTSESSWAERAAERSPSVQRSRSRSIKQAQQIVDAARRLIAEKGDRFTTQELAKEAGIALQTFYRYFGSKDQLLLAVLEDIHAEGNARFIEGARDLTDPLERVKYYVTSAVAGQDGARADSSWARFVTGQHWYLYQLFPEEMSKPTPFAILVAEDLTAAQKQGLIGAFDVDQAASFIANLITAVFHHHAYAPPGQVDRHALAEQLWGFCLNGINGMQAAAVSDVSAPDVAKQKPAPKKKPRTAKP
jgi:AcrR family transcriptional regulator